MRSNDLWIFLFFLGVLVFNWPFLTIFEGSLPYGLFILWALFITLIAFFAIRRDRDGTH
ncbi:hypothetical protein N9903_01420 [bacterium]|nr:hypothetical protein [bacterium]